LKARLAGKVPLGVTVPSDEELLTKVQEDLEWVRPPVDQELAAHLARFRKDQESSVEYMTVMAKWLSQENWAPPSLRTGQSFDEFMTDWVRKEMEDTRTPNLSFITVMNEKKATALGKNWMLTCVSAPVLKRPITL
jgi:hypothetical protein